MELAAPVDLARLLEPWVQATPDAVAVHATEGRVTWRALDDASTRLAHGYRRLGLTTGDRLASLMPDRVSLLAHYLACFRSGLVATPLNYRYAVPEIDHALEVSGAAAIVAHAERAHDIAASAHASGLPVVTAEGNGDGPSLEGPSLEELLTVGARPHRVRAGAGRLQGARRGGVPRRDPAEPHRQGGPRLAQAPRRGPRERPSA
jgi:long-chain acyl-CoA synthetase